MNLALRSVGWRTVDEVKSLHLFEHGKVKNKPLFLEKAKAAGEKLAKTIILANKIKNNS
jgi:hypothetical protein